MALFINVIPAGFPVASQGLFHFASNHALAVTICFHLPRPLSWNEFRHRAITFSKDWTGAKREQAEAQTFWNKFFEVFGIRRRAVASFEEPVRNISGQYGYIGLFWRGMVLVEHKTRGKDPGKAGSQAFEYIQDLARAGPAEEISRYVIVLISPASPFNVLG